MNVPPPQSLVGKMSKADRLECSGSYHNKTFQFVVSDAALIKDMAASMKFKGNASRRNGQTIGTPDHVSVTIIYQREKTRFNAIVQTIVYGPDSEYWVELRTLKLFDALVKLGMNSKE